MMEWTALGSWVMLGTASAALIFSVACYRMIRTILQHVLKFDPDYQKHHEEIADDES